MEQDLGNKSKGQSGGMKSSVTVMLVCVKKNIRLFYHFDWDSTESQKCAGGVTQKSSKKLKSALPVVCVKIRSSDSSVLRNK